MAANLNVIKRVLGDKHYHMNHSWLNDCVEYFLGENEQANTDEILDFVISQWQLSDLREISNEVGCLPPNLRNQKLTKLNGNYILQIDKSYDISTAKYKQMEKIRNIVNENDCVTEQEEKKEFFEMKSKRMMDLFLTDGIQEVFGIEYQPMRTLKDKIVPGIKILIKGPVICRKGVLLLDDSKVQMLGGEVSDLLVPNAAENIFARIFNLPENPNPYQEEMDGDDNDKLFEDEMDFDVEMLNEIENNCGDENHPQKLSKSNKNVSRFSNNKSMEKVNKTENTTINSLPVCFEQSKSQASNNLNDSDDEWIGQIDESQLINDLNQQVQVPSSARPRNEQQFNDDLDFPEFDYDASAIENLEKERKNVNQPFNTGRVNPIRTLVTSKPTLSKQMVNKKESTKIPANQSSSIPNKPKVGTLPAMSPLMFNQSADSTRRSTSTSGKSTPTSSKTSRPSLTGDKSSTPKKLHTKNVRPDHKITDFMQRLDSKTKESEPKKLCDFIADIKSELPSSVAMEKTVRSKIKDTNPLERINNQFKLDGKITDETGSLLVSISTKILDRYIGYTCEEFSQKKKLCRKFPKEYAELEIQLREALKNAQKNLISTVGLFKLQIIPNEIKPVVVSIRPLTDEENRIIDNNLKLRKNNPPMIL